MKRDSKKAFRTSLKYDKEIKDEVETEGRKLSDLSINLVQEILQRQFPEISGLEDTSPGIFGKSQATRMNLSRLFTVTITG